MIYDKIPLSIFSIVLDTILCKTLQRKIGVKSPLILGMRQIKMFITSLTAHYH